MFSALHARFSANALPHGAFAPALFTTVVGQKPSAAQYFLNDPDEVIELCQSLRLHSTRANRNRSMGDLKSLHSAREWTGQLGGMPALGRGRPRRATTLATLGRMAAISDAR